MKSYIRSHRGHTWGHIWGHIGNSHS